MFFAVGYTGRAACGDNAEHARLCRLYPPGGRSGPRFDGCDRGLAHPIVDGNQLTVRPPFGLAFIGNCQVFDDRGGACRPARFGPLWVVRICAVLFKPSNAP